MDVGVENCQVRVSAKGASPLQGHIFECVDGETNFEFHRSHLLSSKLGF
jgi:hypothetical protein